MKKNISIISVIFFLSVFITLLIYYNFLQRSKDIEISELKDKSVNRPAVEPEHKAELMYFSEWHIPYSNIIPSEVNKRIWSQIDNMPKEMHKGNQSTNWICIGPYGMVYLDDTIWSGRVLDLKFDATSTPYIASASGGLWHNGVCLSNTINSLAIGAVELFPVNGILIGTGESGTRNGTGLYRSTNNGQNWSAIVLTPQPNGFWEIKSSPVPNTNLIHAATDTGYFRSTDYGSTWNRIMSGDITDIVLDTTNSTIYLVRENNQDSSGVWKSTNNGTTWAHLVNLLPGTNFGRTSLAFGFRQSDNKKILYASIAKNQIAPTPFHGVFQSTNEGINWANVTSNIDTSTIGVEHYKSAIAVDSKHSDTVYIGGTTMWRSYNGGGNWTEIIKEHQNNAHVDIHAIRVFDGGILHVGCDGGYQQSTDYGNSWVTGAENKLPITQYYHFDVKFNDTSYVIGGSQDNGISRTTSGAQNWGHVFDGDGFGVFFGPPNIAFGITNAGPGVCAVHKSTNNGLNWNDFITGFDQQNWEHRFKSRYGNPDTIYVNDNYHVVYSGPPYTQWSILGDTAAFPQYVSNLNVTQGINNEVIVYACMGHAFGSLDTSKLKVYDNGIWVERSNDFPKHVFIPQVVTIGATYQARVRTVALNNTTTYNSTAYALMNGMDIESNGKKIFKTTNKGVNWINISGDLPNIPLGDLVPHPTDSNILYLGTEMGSFKTTNGGNNWTGWNDGMPTANIITEMKLVSLNGTYYIFASTYGRSIWKREIDDPVGITNNNSGIPDRYNLHQNHPNPFNPITKINYELPKDSKITLTIYDILGREVKRLVNNEVKPAGNYNVEFNGQSYASSVYFYRIEAEELNGSKFIDSKKMVLVK